MDERLGNPLEHYYDKQNDETKACLLALKSIILSVDPEIVHFRKYQILFFQIQKFQYQLFVGKQEEDIAGLCSGQKGDFSERWAATKRLDFYPRNKSAGRHSD